MRTPPRRLPCSVISRFLLCVLCGFLAGNALAEDAPKVAGTDVPPPKRTKLVLPEYPAEAQEKGLHGIVILEVTIDGQGKVVDAKVIRSIPPFDEPALQAVRKWEYEVTRVDGKAVSVLLTVPITFALRLPEVSRQEGVPELRGGMSPIFPKGARNPGRVALDVSLDSEGRITEAEVLSGDSPFREALLTALRSWRFAPPGEGVQISFRIEASFEPEQRGAHEKVSIRLSGPRRSESAAAASPLPPPVTLPAAGSEAPALPAAAPSDAPAPAAAPPAAEPAPTPAALPAPAIAAPTAASAPAATTQAPAPAPPMEVLSAPLPPRPPAPPPVAGSSAVENVSLGLGVPDLSQGRRPVVPPFARMSGTVGTVEVRFAVNAAGQAVVLNVEGTEALKAAAQGAVASWSFRRTTTERLYLTAVFAYEKDAAKASVTVMPEAPVAPSPAPTPAPTPAPSPTPPAPPGA